MAFKWYDWGVDATEYYRDQLSLAWLASDEEYDHELLYWLIVSYNTNKAPYDRNSLVLDVLAKIIL